MEGKTAEIVQFTDRVSGAGRVVQQFSALARDRFDETDYFFQKSNLRFDLSSKTLSPDDVLFACHATSVNCVSIGNASNEERTLKSAILQVAGSKKTETVRRSHRFCERLCLRASVGDTLHRLR